jgi:hypothetical protein
MASYYLNEAALDLPNRTFEDKTIHGLEAKLPGDKTLGVFVHRRPIEGEKSLRELVDEHVRLNQKRLMGFSVVDEVPAPVGGVPGFVLRTRWRSEKKELCQLQAHVVRGGQHMIFAVGGPIDERAACDEAFDSILATLTWRAD